ncbi:MAG: transcriptional antiterminator, Rof [Gammaproteobacteria bacterium]|nr:transcriptional antiterminator, Rof [Gammaproteobacteria bacterium]
MADDAELYIPVECALHSLYELAIIRSTACRLVWHSRGEEKRNGTVVPLDLLIRNKTEYLKVRTEDAELLEIRLDKIISFNPL